MSDMTQMYDVVVVGGGAAGLSGALALGRARRSVLVIDSGSPRNAPASHVHNYLGREGTPPSELLAIGREEVAGYGVEFLSGEALVAERLPDDAYRVVCADGTAVAARRLLVTTGLTDELPPVEGLAERWGREVLHCPYCHGWEVRDAAIGVIAVSPMAVHQALLWRQWSEDVTLFLHQGPEPSDEEYEQLAARGIAVVDGEVAGLETAGDRLAGVRLADGRVVERSAVVVQPRFTARSGLLESLGLRPVPLEAGGHTLGSYVEADPTGLTAAAGVWVAGNVTGLMDQVIGAAAAGLKAGAAINGDLVQEDTRRAVEARNAPSGAQLWDDRYRESDRIWSGNPNDVLVREAGELKPGRALDLGCGEGADAVWLARRGWQVTATDISRVALARAAEHAAEAGVADRVDWRFHDLGVSFPEGEYDLVSAHYLHSMGDLPRERILHRAARAVAPGGVLLIVGHAGFPAWDHHHAAMHFPTPTEVLASLELPEGEWEVLLSEEFERVQNDPDGNPTTRTDNALKLRRR
ncbi:methyltransferase domain-containing protein [Streptomyces sp. NPDC088864]|uniref:methyltransferase domain-containing protein n=1 Tax=Streptomyces sp. NPDC088864 TaxID=3365910 RepID=UPI00382ED898